MASNTTPVELVVRPDTGGLAYWQRRLIGEIDPPITAEGRDGSPGRNAGESDVTARIHDGRLWVYKAWTSRRLDGEPAFLYTPVTARVHAISREELDLLREDDWTTGDPAVRDRLLPRLEQLVAPLPAGGWRFDDVPAAAARTAPPARILMLNPIEQCNLRCTYCYFGGAYTDTRPHRTAWTSNELMKAAIDQFLVDEPSIEDAWRAIHFFGGEPLMAFKRIKGAVADIEARLARMEHPPANLIVQVTSNGILLDDTIVRFLIDHDIYLNLSIDGPNHDRYRVDKTGAGTHDRVRAKIDWLAETYPDWFRTHVGMICVLTKPVDVRATYRYFAEWPAARQALAWDFDLVLPDGNSASDQEMAKLFDQERLVWDLFVRAHELGPDARDRSLRYHFAFRHGFLHRAFHRALNQPPRDGGPLLHHLLGVQVVPGCEYLVLGADGTLYSSYEFQSEGFRVGNVLDGVDFTRGVAQLASFRDAVASSSCSTCWAAPICTLMVPEVPFRAGDTEADVRRKVAGKATRCKQEREALLQGLQARVDIESLHGAEALQAHHDEWSTQRSAAGRVDYFY
jgi:uncharacterized protein